MGDAGPDAHAAPDTSFGPDDRVPGFVHREGAASHGTGTGTDPTLGPLEGDAPLGQQLEGAQPDTAPEVGRSGQGIGGTGHGAGHIGTDDTGLICRIDIRRCRGEPPVRRDFQNGANRTDGNAVATAGTGREEPDLGQRARRTEIMPGDDPTFRRLQQPLEPVTHGVPEKIPPGSLAIVNHTGRNLADAGAI
jgi:hypothetical protein